MVRSDSSHNATSILFALNTKDQGEHRPPATVNLGGAQLLTLESPPSP